MCGRFTLTKSAREVAEHFGLVTPPELEPRFNIAPGQEVWGVRGPDGAREAFAAEWGLLPAFVRDAKGARRPINARIETAAEKPSFREAWRHRRCLIPADGWYEWQGAMPHHVRHPEGRLFAFAGLFEPHRSEDGQLHWSFAVVTTAAAPSLRALHHRMPVIVEAGAYADWLDPRRAAPEHGFAGDAELAAFEIRAVSERVNSVRNDSPACLDPPAQGSLF